MNDFRLETLMHDPIHGYIPYIDRDPTTGSTTERDLIESKWMQRMRYIHQLQTAWWVYPSAEHTRFQHCVGVMHLASRWVNRLFSSLKEICPEVPSLGYVETLMRVSGLLHDVGHGPFGHFFDDHFLKPMGHTHESIGAAIIRGPLAEIINGIRSNPNSQLSDDEQLDPDQVAWIIQRPTDLESQMPRWLVMLRSLLSGIYTIDNMDFVLRDAYMSGYSQKSYDMDRMLRYSFFSESGLTIHERGIEALLRFMAARAELFRNVYFHRNVRAIDLTLADLFPATIKRLFDCDPIMNLDRYHGLTEQSLLVDVRRWADSEDHELSKLGTAWCQLIDGRLNWEMAAQRTIVFNPGDSEDSSIFSEPSMVEQKIRQHFPSSLADVPLRVDIARQLFRPQQSTPVIAQNFIQNNATGTIRALSSHELVNQLPVSHRICRVYSQGVEYAQEISSALDAIISGRGGDDLTNM